MQTITYKYRIKDKSAKNYLRRHAWAVNQVWNWCNAYQKDIENRYKAGGPFRSSPSFFDFCKLVKGASRELGITQHSVYSVCSHFVLNRDRFKKHLKFRVSSGPSRCLGWIPFEKKCRQIDGNSITYRKKTFKVFGTKTREIPETAKGGCFVEDASGNWYICLNVNAPARKKSELGVSFGIDLGLKSFATLSTGQKIEAPQFYRQLEGKLAIAQRAHNNKRVRAIHDKIRNQRFDFLHKLSTQLVTSSNLIVVGDINSSQLARTWISKSVSDAGWSTFRAMLKYKCQQAAVPYREVDEKFTTQTCSHCGALPPERPKGIAGLGIREWVCSNCDETHDRDVNAARNILNLALGAQRRADESLLVTTG